MIRLLVGADDRTGALEAAGACADAGAGAVWVGTELAPPANVAVVDLGSRHLDPGDAARHAARLDQGGPGAMAHKIDSTLRGNWAHELVGRQRASGRRVLVVPALPAEGRRCAGGVVYEHGQPVADGTAGADPRRPVASSRPADHLALAGAASVTEVAGADALGSWLASADGPRFAVCDAETDADLQTIAAAWASHPDVLVAGTAAVIGAVTAALLGGGTDRPAPPPVAAPVLVVCGSLHTLARRQVAHVGALGVAVAEPGSFLGTVTDALHAGRPGVVVSPPWRAGAVPAADAQRVAVQLAATAAEVAGAVTVGTLIVIGGDTAAAVLGPEPVTVGGTLAPGIPWARRPDGGPLIVTRAGGFGSRSSLAELVWGRLGT